MITGTTLISILISVLIGLIAFIGKAFSDQLRKIATEISKMNACIAKLDQHNVDVERRLNYLERKIEIFTTLNQQQQQ